MSSAAMTAQSTCTSSLLTVPLHPDDLAAAATSVDIELHVLLVSRKDLGETRLDD